MDAAQLFAFGIVLAWLAGIRAYLTVFGVGLAGALGWAELPGQLELCSSPWVLVTAGALTVLEFSADKIPGVDSLWDLLQTVLRIPIGAFLAGAALGGPEQGLSGAGLVAGAGTALLAHALKAGTRAAINTSPEPLSNWVASGGEDGLAVTALWLAFSYPWLALALALGGSLLLFASVWWLLRRLFRRNPPAAATATR